MSNKFYVTTPIYYVNDKPHIGHAYTTVMADVYARFYRELLGKDEVFFLTGTDEHGTKVAQSAAKNNIDPQEFTDKISAQYKDVWQKLDISYDEFFRTTDPRHKIIVQEFLQKLYNKGLIYKSLYEGMYCVGCEKFLSFDEISNGVCTLHPNLIPIEQKEENYFFKFKELSSRVFSELQKNTYSIFPEERKNEIIGKIKHGIEDISISRLGVSWGIELPWDRKHTVYVWVDALINYYSATQMYPERKDFWPPTLHLMAKDILWFHALVWEGLLLANDLALPKAVFAHGFFTIEGQKMSKSLGNVIDPLDLIAEYGKEGTRYLLITSFQFGKDGDISLDRFKEKFNSDLANGIGNLVSRIAKIAEKLEHNPANVEKTLLVKDEKIADFFILNKPDEALRYIWSKIAILDQKMAQDKPWEIKSVEELDKTLKVYIEGLIVIGAQLKPFLPETSAKILDIFTKDKIFKPDPLFLRK
jgi:methionyl-tRNA synthetase